MIYCGNCGQPIGKELNNQSGNVTCEQCEAKVPSFQKNREEEAFGFYCSGCGKANLFSVSHAGKLVGCLHCWMPTKMSEQVIQLIHSAVSEQNIKEIPDTIEKVTPNLVEQNLVDGEQKFGFCAICQTDITKEESAHVENCPSCNTIYHQDCWEENQGCAIYGCLEVPETEHNQSVEIPPSYWGKEHKPCPNCQEEILATARRCKYCGTVLHTEVPIDGEQFQRHQELQKKLPKFRKRIIWIVILCIIPFTAPVFAIFAPIWYRSNQDDIKALPGLYIGMIKIGIGVAIFQTLFIICVFILYQPSSLFY